VPAEVAREAVKNKYRVLDIQHHPENYDQVPSAAKKLGLPLLTIHSPCDEIGRRMIVQAIKELGWRCYSSSASFLGLARFPSFAVRRPDRSATRLSKIGRLGRL